MMTCLFRQEMESEDREFLDAARKIGWRMVDCVVDLRGGDTVVARHAAWPWPRSLQRCADLMGTDLVNDARAYAFADDVQAWSAALGDMTVPCWEDFARIPLTQAVVVKGKHADKGRWSRMYAEGRDAAIALRSELWRDSGMRGDTIVARAYVPLARVGDALGGACPPSEEWRVFVLDGEVVGAGAYWPAGDCDLRPIAPASEIPAAWLAEGIRRVREACPSLRWFTLDVGRAEGGEFVVIEVSDGQRAGLSEVEAPALVAAMNRVFWRAIKGR
jgi:hypothetical protein